MLLKKLQKKKRGTLFAFIGFLEVLDYPNLPITTNKAHAIMRERRCITQGDF